MRTTIEWATHSWNPGIYGCQEVSPACAHCYAASMAHRLAAMGRHGYAAAEGEAPITEKRPSGVHWTGVVRVDPAPNPRGLPKRRPHNGRKAKVFVTSMGDLFHDDVPFAFLDQVFDLIEAHGPVADFLLLTKRTRRMAGYAAHRRERGKYWPQAAWAGTTVEDQARANERVPHLLTIPAPVRFISCEPLLGPISLRSINHDGIIAIDALAGLCGIPIPHAPCGRIDWVITGGESGPKARRSDPDHFRALRDDCRQSGAAFFFKQWGDAFTRQWGETSKDEQRLDGKLEIGMPIPAIGREVPGV